MSKRRKGNPSEQLSLTLHAKPPEKVKATIVSERVIQRFEYSTRNVVAFVDAGTLAVRQDAMRRVAKAGIFPTPGAIKQAR